MGVFSSEIQLMTGQIPPLVLENDFLSGTEKCLTARSYPLETAYPEDKKKRI